MFELVCLHLQSIATAYFWCLKDLIKPSNGEATTIDSPTSSSVCLGTDAKPSYDSVKLINCTNHFAFELNKHLITILLFLLSVILDGYDKMCKASKTMEPLLYELEREHLHPFGLTWSMLNKRIYQRFVYWEAREWIPECFSVVICHFFF